MGLLVLHRHFFTSTCLGIFRNRMKIFYKTLGGLGSLMHEV